MGWAKRTVLSGILFNFPVQRAYRVSVEACLLPGGTQIKFVERSIVAYCAISSTDIKQRPKAQKVNRGSMTKW